MQKKPILAVMAAGIGSRFGGLKQMTPFGLHGESLIDYSLYDALRAGFERVVFIVNTRIRDDFRQLVGRHVENRMEVTYVMQELDRLPEGLTVPEGRAKPWGTAHAILCAGDALDAPFCALNGDDFYGLDAMRQIFAFLDGNPERNVFAMVGFELQNTLSEAGYVSRGICEVDERGYLKSIVERLHVIPTIDGPMYTLDGQQYTRLPGDTTVSMNMWGFTPRVVGEIEKRFPVFYRDAMANNPLKAEFYLPNLVGDLLKENAVSVKALRSGDRWFGVTNASDRPLVEKALRELTAQGVYPDGLWK
ncbi:MAG: NTP transferase domain-containing protein [Clostridiales bacterium]|nr:NTP transferase domain-containing protein [Clostridiales bacterium]